MRLTSLDQVPQSLRPAYDPSAHGVGIVHIGLGAFHKAHQAALTDLAIAASGGDWRILGVSLRSPKAADELAPQHGLYTLIERGTSTSARVIGSICGAICSAEDPALALDAMANPATKIVSITVTEKAYGLDRASGRCDRNHPAVAADLKSPHKPHGVLGMLVRALDTRRQAGISSFTVLCCDNLPDNGHLLRGATIDFANDIDPELAGWIAEKVAFPSTMVDRITPAATAKTLADAEALLGVADLAATETEPFYQWVIEDNFPLGRPDWEAAGVIFTDNVVAFEAMKLRMLNGSHSMLAYAGFHAGRTYVRDVMADTALAKLVRRHLDTAAATLPLIEGIDTADYADALIERFRNPEIAHQTFQIAMDGSEKLPQRIFSALADARSRGIDCRAFAFATAAWLRHISGSTHDCDPYELRDPRAAELSEMADGKSAVEIVAHMRKASFVSETAATDDAFWAEVTEILTAMLTEPMTTVIEAEAAR
ncbi:mannitol dehydrogenase family protein [Marivivens donghaensis]|uniref:Mannitol dehydrogenase family protein n=1 Tax=Marivivens donghaensis TaxID=1699413 RepID=A0ABX0VUG7_9RHOB|nr:mannitol dehydrogenase family protein [Marivivens donghaensis]NIY70817.1 mannitol dehydrogenase family protein [Marivivens donghaensis]